MSEDIPLPFNLPAVARKKVTVAFDGGRITSDGGAILRQLHDAARRSDAGPTAFISGRALGSRS
jgi:hypothetical protein